MSIEAIYRAIQFIEVNLKEDITIADMSAAANFSLYHFCRTFSSIVHHTPYDYLMRRRLSEAARELNSTKQKILDIALDYQFKNLETFSRAFKRMFGTQPSQWRKTPNLDPRGFMPALTRKHLEHFCQQKLSHPTQVKLEAFQLVGLMTRLDANHNAVVEREQIVDRLFTITGRDSSPVFGILFYPQDWQAQGNFYFAGQAADEVKADGTALVSKRIPETSFAQFTHSGTSAELNLTFDYIYAVWLTICNNSTRIPYLIEVYDHGDQRKIEHIKLLIPITT